MDSYRRPAYYQIINHYKCKSCGDMQEVQKGYSAAMPCRLCGGYVEKTGESYPSNSDEWDERRVGDINSPWINDRTGKFIGY
jgi:hypothetical protein